MTDITPLTPFAEVARRIAATAIYPKKCEEQYLLMGLYGELGEVANKAKKVMRDDDGKMSLVTLQAIAQEVGDVLWYMVMLEAGARSSETFEEIFSDEMGEPFLLMDLEPRSEVGDTLLDALTGCFDSARDRYVENQDGNAYGPDWNLTIGSWVGLLKVLSLGVPDIPKSEDSKEFLFKWFKAVSVAGVVQNLLNKLEDRKERGVLSGAGDSR